MSANALTGQLRCPAAGGPACRTLAGEFGSMRMIDILPVHLREWVAGLKAGGVKPLTIRQSALCAAILPRHPIVLPAGEV